MNPSPGQDSKDLARASGWLGRGMAPAWPAELLEPFCLRMSSQGMCVSRALMICDRRYALEQLAHAHNMADDTLRMMAVQLFRHFEARQSGIAGLH
ncbi:MAG: hypothetical protein KAF64_12240 [Hydrogenophaga sp.]|uniref:hypothetical protein n=1 Tax=Hydrogenophaga sp. TaxID=1904254 RepID=UPI0025BD19D1|nr:hypothetical protein [Hydrogenophaga sp.]MBU7574119.1 hypothetical protein [Hydrogenophaga sp.]